MNLFEEFDYHDLVGQLDSKITIDKYVSKMGEDSEIITIAFTIKGEKAADDLTNWFERGYNWILDAQVSDGEISRNKHIVFIEINRRSTAPEKIIDLLKDLGTLTDYKLTDWTVTIDDEDYDANVDTLKQVMTLSPHEYRKQHEEDLNEMRSLAGVAAVTIYDNKKDQLLKNYIAKAGL
jgi:hypothetical protein